MGSALFTRVLRKKEEFSDVHGYKRGDDMGSAAACVGAQGPARPFLDLADSICVEVLLQHVATCYGPTSAGPGSLRVWWARRATAPLRRGPPAPPPGR